MQGASITELFQVCLVVSQILGEGALVQMFCWYAREKWDQWQKGSVYGAKFMEFGQAGAKMCRGYLKVVNWGWRCKSQKGALFIGKAGSHYVILLYCETLLQVLLGIYCKRFYWIPLFTILLLFYVFEVGKTKSATQSVLMILTLNGLFQKNSQVFYFTPENFISLTLHPFPLCMFFPLQCLYCNF